MPARSHVERERAESAHLVAREPGSLATVGVTPRRRAGNLGSKIFMTLMFCVGVTGLARFAAHVSEHDHSPAAADQPGSGMIVGTEIIDVWLPPFMLELACPRAQSVALQSHQDLRRLLEARGQEGLWYAVTIRTHRADRGFDDMQFVRRPHCDAEHFREFLEITANAGAATADRPGDDFMSASVHVLPAELVMLDAGDVMAALQKRPSALVCPDHRAHHGP